MASVNRLLIVTGSMRSGTSLMGHILQQRPDGRRAHPDLAFDNDESEWVVSIFSKLRAALGGDKVGYGDTDINVVLTDDLLDALEVTPGSLNDRIAQLRRRLTDEILRLAPEGPYPDMFGLKRTTMNYEIGLMDALFDDVRLVFTIRDPRDILLSHSKRVKSQVTEGKALLILAYVLANHAMITRLRKQGREVLAVQYEHAVAHPVDVARQLIAHAGLNVEQYDFDGLLTNKVPNNSSFGSGEGTKFVEGGGITTSSIGRHKTLLEPTVAAFVSYLCGHILTANDYETSPHNVDWDPKFEPLLKVMAKRCKQLHISLHAVEARLKELNAPLTDLS